jgi:putative flippase GtrA
MVKINKHLLETTRFAIVGSIGFVANYIVLSIAQTVVDNHVLAEIIAVLFALQITFILHDAWTYKEGHHGYDKKKISRYFSYLLSNFIGSAITVLLFALVYGLTPRFFALALAAIGGMVWNFVMNKFVIWRKYLFSDTKTE